MASTTTSQPNPAELTQPKTTPFVETYAALLEQVGKNTRVRLDNNQGFFETGDPEKPTKSFQVVVGKGNLAQAMEQIDKSGAESYRLFAIGMGLPVDPFSPKLLRPVIMGEFQIVWHRADGQTEEALQQIIGKQVARVKHYLVELEDLKNKPQAAPKVQGIKDLVRAGSGGGGGTRSPRSGAGSSYQLDATRQEIWSKFDKQKGIIVKAFETAGGTATAAKLKEIIDMLPEGQKMTTNQPVERVIAFYLAEWKRNGLVVTVDTPAPAQAQAPEPAPEKKEPEAPAADTSKLNTSNGKKNKKDGKKK